jgi:hypothetical protein
MSDEETKTNTAAACPPESALLCAGAALSLEKFDALEVKPERSGWYLVTMFQFGKEKEEHPDYIKEWLEFNGEGWEYGYYIGHCYVCFIHERDDT